MSNNNFNDILRSKFSEKEHPFDERNWKAMRTMIDESRAKKKRTLFILGSLALLLCAIGTAGILEWKSTIGNANVVSNSVKSNTASPSAATNSATAATTTRQTINSTPSISTNNLLSNSSNNSVASANKTQATKAVSVAANSQPLKNAGNKKHKTKSGNSAIGASDKEIADLNKTIADVENNTAEKNVISVKESSEAPLTQAKLPVNSTPPVTPKVPAPPVAKVNTKAPDTASSLPQRFSDEPRIYNGKKQMISIDAGTYYSGGWSPSINITQGSGFNYVVGVGYTRYLSKKWFLKTGIQFSDFGHMGSYTYNYQHSSVQNPNLINDSAITTKRLYYLSIPVQFEKFVGHKSSLGLGGSVSFLLSSTASATTYQQLDNNPPANYQNYSQNIHLNGYNTLTASAYGLYRYTFNRHFSTYLMIYFMTPVDNKSFFGENLYFYNTGAKLLVSYTL